MTWRCIICALTFRLRSLVIALSVESLPLTLPICACDDQARDAAQAEMVALKSQADREQQEFEAKWRELGDLIERDRKGKDAPKSPKGRHRQLTVSYFTINC